MMFLWIKVLSVFQSQEKKLKTCFAGENMAFIGTIDR